MHKDEIIDHYNSLALRRRMLLHSFNQELRDSIEELFKEWIEANPGIHHIEIGLVQEDPDEDDGFFSSLSFHVCTDDEGLEDRLIELFQESVLDSHMEMIIDVLSEPITVGKEGHLE